ncbi:MAG: hypothetical protein IJ494_00165 [Bacteroides sp.]|nr:hypothetical protein [Bacteroides sp.]
MTKAGGLDKPYTELTLKWEFSDNKLTIKRTTGDGNVENETHEVRKVSNDEIQLVGGEGEYTWNLTYYRAKE